MSHFPIARHTTSGAGRRFILFAALVLTSVAVHSQLPPQPAASAAKAQATGADSQNGSLQTTPECPSAKDFAMVFVKRVFPTPLLDEHGDVKKITRPSNASREPHVGLRKAISVEVEHLDILLARERCGPKRNRVVLYLDGRPLKDLLPYPPSGPMGQTLHFQLDRNETSREVWTHLLGQPSFAPRLIPVSVGLEDEYAVPSDQAVLFDVIPHLWFAVWSGVLLVLFVAFWFLAAKSDILRDPGPKSYSGARKRYSLARTQAAVWFFLILASYLFIGLITGDYGSTITSTVLELMGISAATVIGSSVIDAGPAKPAPSGPAVTPDPSAATKGRWWMDILSDDHGVNFHRFQMAAWTFVLGIIFIQQVYKGLAMPDFDVTLLGLMGISAGTYLGLKTTSE